MTLRYRLAFVASFLLALLLAGRADAQQATVLLNASPSVIMADGRSSTTITATISGLNAAQVPDGTAVSFTTTAGLLSAQAVSSVGGIARVTLTSSPVPGYATVTATFVGSNGSGSGQYRVEFTSDKTLANTDQGEADWIRISSSDYLAYSADSEVIDASAAKQGVKFSYRGLIISADALQADVATGMVRARNVVIQRGHREVNLMLLAYSITAGQGQALSDSLSGSTTVQPVSVTGATLDVKPMNHHDLVPTGFDFVDISGSRVIVTATSVAVRMNDKIQLKHASIFVDSKHIVSMPYQIMPLTTNEIFGQQVVGYGSDGLFLDVPYYASVSPKSTSAFYLRSTSAAEQDGTYYSGRQGLAVDYVNTYGTFDGKTTGTLDLMGITRGDWGANWTHTQQFTNSLKGFFNVDVPEHNSLFASSSIVQELHGYSVNFTSTDASSPVQNGYQSNQQNIETYIQSDSHILTGTRVHGLLYNSGLTLEDSMIKTVVPGSATSSEWITTKSAGLNLFTTPYHLGSSQLTDSVNFSQAQANTGQAPGLQAKAELNLNTRFSSMATSSMSFTFSHDPVTLNALEDSLVPAQFRPVANQENYAFTLNLSPKKNRWNALFSGTYAQPLGNTSIGGGLNFFPSSNWILSVTDSYSSFADVAFQDLELSIGRRIGSRELQLYWDTVDDRIRFNMGSAQF